MSEPLYFEDLAVGQTWRSFARTITETDVVHFAGMTGDYDPLHVDHHFARETPFGRPIAHGLLGLSILAGLGINSPRVNTAAFVSIENWRFLKPIFFGDTVRAENEVVALASEGRRRGRVTWKRRLVNQDGVAVQEGLLITLVNRRTPLGREAKAADTTAGNSFETS
jgi:3-hydroxybutyryl-CoA dehydratase